MHISLAILADSPGFFELGAFHLVVLALLGGALFCLVQLLGRLRTLEGRLERLKVLDEIPVSLRTLIESSSELDLRRLEHLLIDLRDDQRRVNEQLMQIAERPRVETIEVPQAGPADRPAPVQVPLAERVVNRLLALGYERIQLLGTAAEIEDLVGGDGEVLVEARRAGAVCKGRVTVQAGAISEVELRSNHDMFP